MRNKPHLDDSRCAPRLPQYQHSKWEQDCPSQLWATRSRLTDAIALSRLCAGVVADLLSIRSMSWKYPHQVFAILWQHNLQNRKLWHYRYEDTMQYLIQVPCVHLLKDSLPVFFLPITICKNQQSIDYSTSDAHTVYPNKSRYNKQKYNHFSVTRCTSSFVR